MLPQTLRVNASAWAQICEASDRLAAAADEVLESEMRLSGATGKGRRKAARSVRDARKDHDALCRALGGLMIAADLPEGTAVVANGLSLWHTTDHGGDTILRYTTAAIVEPTPGY